MMDVLKKIWKAWKRFGQIVGDFIGRIFLTLFYFSVFVPFALISRLLTDPLGLKNAKKVSYWVEREHQAPDLQDSHRQY